MPLWRFVIVSLGRAVVIVKKEKFRRAIAAKCAESAAVRVACCREWVSHQGEGCKRSLLRTPYMSRYIHKRIKRRAKAERIEPPAFESVMGHAESRSVGLAGSRLAGLARCECGTRSAQDPGSSLPRYSICAG